MTSSAKPIEIRLPSALRAFLAGSPAHIADGMPPSRASARAPDAQRAAGGDRERVHALGMPRSGPRDDERPVAERVVRRQPCDRHEVADAAGALAMHGSDPHGRLPEAGVESVWPPLHAAGEHADRCHGYLWTTAHSLAALVRSPGAPLDTTTGFRRSPSRPKSRLAVLAEQVAASVVLPAVATAAGPLGHGHRA